MNKVKVSVVSYLNSKPFIYGLQQSSVNSEIELSLDIPSVCAQKLLDNQVDVGLIPVAVIPQLKESYIISDYCIAADGKVLSVMLYSQVELHDIQNIVLDYQSRTSVQLVQILAKEFWKIKPQFIVGEENYIPLIKDTTAAVVIGDRTFELNGKFNYEYELTKERKKNTKLPFLFACLVANKKLPETFLQQFNNALKMGIEKKELVAEQQKSQYKSVIDINSYYNKYIHFDLSITKKQGLELFLQHLLIVKR